MPKKVAEKSAVEIRQIQKPGLHAVGGVPGLLLQVTPFGSKSWVLRVRVGNKRRHFGLGGFPEVTLAMARDDARECRRRIRQGIDPAAERRAAKERLLAEQAKEVTFAEASRQYHRSKSVEFKSRKHSNDWISSLEREAFPVIGHLPVSEITLPHVLKTLEPIWLERTETATRVRQRIEAVLSWATVSGYRQGDNPARWRGNLDAVLPKPAKIKKKANYPALPRERLGEFMRELRLRAGMSARALEFLIHTGARSGEVRGATWDEIDLDSRLWTIPAERMKSGKPHRVPLSPHAIGILADLPRLNSLVFPAAREGKMSDMAINNVVRRMHEAHIKRGGSGYIDPFRDGQRIVPHGFRSTFKDWARADTSFPDEVSELALAHVSTDATRAAYARDELLDQRRALMTDWSRYIATEMKKAAKPK
ncbi:integrase arm-type DNA-binding domain-containing protein [Guyparkeria hydrothermalis]|uniref:tyrosine-type recombinase/integrase n=1 Tax=Guyparkeria hydrothermalis TaxID=923 RepID=UPI0020214B6A|nr:site-specific integrase [Guyparkeria hydrothermalis]MCL7744251.1 integrase arm-type DNA-binding domain-containing protein [Guyparkeria hydrothermalis]